MPITITGFHLPWAMRNHDVNASSRASIPGPADPSVLPAPWPFQAQGEVRGAPAIDYAGNLYVGTTAGQLYRVAPSGTGEVVYAAQAPITTSPALVEAAAGGEGEPPGVGAVYFGDDDGFLRCVDRDGSLLWALTPAQGVPLRSSPAAYRGPTGGLTSVYIGCDDGRLFAVTESSPMSAATQWEYTTAAPLRTSPVLSVDGGSVHVATADGYLHVLDAATGQLRYQPVSFGPSVHTPAVDNDGTVYLTDKGGFLHAVDRAGQLLWSVHLGVDLYAGPALGLDGTTLAAAGGMLFAVSTGGTVQWSEPLPADRFVHEPMVDSNGVCVVTGSGGTVAGIMTDAGVAGTRVVWQVRPSPTGLTAASMDGHGRIYVGDSAGAVHAIDDAPAFQLFAQSDVQQAGNLDVYSLRESYGILDPARTVRVTRASSADRQPATSLDRRVIGYVSHRVTSDDTMVATPRGTREEVMTPPGGAFSATSDETSPAFTPIDDLLGTPKSPHLNEYVAVTSNVSGLRRLVFVDLAQPTGSPTAVRPFTPWAAALGVPPALLSQLEPAAVEQSHAAFSPDGRKVAWRSADPSSASGQVWLLRLSSSGWHLVPVGPSYPYNPETPRPVSDEPCFSPDSRWIAVRQGLSLAIYDVASASPPVFTTPPQTADEPFHPSWSPDGTEIAMGVRRGGSRDLHIASGAGFATYVELTGTGDSDEPSYDSFKMPPPQVVGLSTDRQVPDATVEVRGRGFDMLHPENNAVEFAHTLRSAPILAPVLAARVDPYLGLGLLTVRVPRLAGHGPITVRTRFGSASSADFHVLPAPARVLQRRTVVGARIRVFGRGFDLSPATAHVLRLTAAGGGTVTATAESGEIVGDEEVLIVRVPAGIAPTATLRVENPYGGGDCPETLGLLTPTVTLLRTVATGPTSGLPSYAGQGGTGVPVRVSGTGFPFDPYFGYGTSSAFVTADVAPALQPVPPNAPVGIRNLAFVTAGVDTADLVAQTFPFPSLGPNHPGGALQILAADSNLPAAAARTTFRIPETDIPIVFVPGTSGSSLDIAPGVMTPVSVSMSTHVHLFPWISKTALPWPLDPLGPLTHIGRGFDYNPTTPNTYLPPGPVFDHPGDARGPRVWAGPEGVAEMYNTLITGNVGNHYLDICKFDATGAPLHPEIVPGTVFEDVMSQPPGFSGSTAWGFTEIYKPMIDFLNRPSPNGWPGRPVCRSGNPATGLCLDSSGQAASGRNAVYLFNLDWRDSIPNQAARLNAFIDAVRGRADVAGRKVAVITHSYGGPVARAYYLNPVNMAQAKVDQVISLGGGFAGVIDPLDILEQGGNWGLGFTFGSLGWGIQKWETQDLAQNWPTAYFQMPNSEAWFSDHGSVVSGRVVNRAYIRDYTTAAREVTSYAGSMAWAGARHNTALAAAQTAFFTPASGPPVPLGDFTGGTGAVYHHRVISKGRMDTVVATMRYSGPSDAADLMLPADPRWPFEMLPTTHWSSVYGDGDSTIPYHGGLGLTDPQDDRVYVLDGVKHGEIPNVPELIGGPGVKGLLQLLLEGSVCSVAQAPTAFRSQNQVTESFATPPPVPALPPGPLRERQESPSPDRWLVEVEGNGHIDVTDANGAHMGPLEGQPYLVEENIPGASYRSGPPAVTAFLGNGTYSVRFTSEVPHVFRARVRPFVGAAALPSFLFTDLRAEQGDVAELTLGPAIGVEGAARLTLTRRADGTSERVQGRALTPVQADDTAPPITAVTITGGTVRVEADDGPGGSGVYRTILSLDGFRHDQYERPLPIPDDVALVMAYSEDNAGNREYPGWVKGALGVSATDVRVDRDGPEHFVTIDVVNLDPLGISGPIHWQALANAPWVQVDPARGTTPQRLRVSVDASQLPQGAGEATSEVVITVLDEQPVVPARRVTVTVTAG